MTQTDSNFLLDPSKEERPCSLHPLPFCVPQIYYRGTRPHAHGLAGWLLFQPFCVEVFAPTGHGLTLDVGR